MVGYNADGPKRDRVLKLMEERDKIESEIRQQTAVLETNNIGMQEPLIDHEGYPRSDIDVYQVRNARHRLICLKNDFKEIMKKIERGLNEVHADLLGTDTPSNPDSNIPCTSSNGHMSNNVHSSGDVTESNETFAVVRYVDTGSPADVAGLCKDDEIVQFGSINSRNFTDMLQIYDLVTHSVGQRIQVKLKRNQNIINLTISPRLWEQPGLLGCQIVAIPRT